jgi:hypothetical protein
LKPGWCDEAREQPAEASFPGGSFKADTDSEYRRKRGNGSRRGGRARAADRKLSRFWAELDRAEQEESAEP